MQAWIRLARRWLVLPEDDPPLPAGARGPASTWNPADGYRRYRLVSFWVAALPTLLLAAGSFLAAGLVPPALAAEDAPELVSAGVAVAGVAFGLLMLAITWWNYALVHLELDMLRYVLSDRAIRLRRGVLNMEEVTLSYANIQNVRYVQGPLQRYFGIADLVVDTAGGGGAPAPGQQHGAGGHRGLIQGVSEPERLRNLILERVRQTKGAGLGDAGEARKKKSARRAQGRGLDDPHALALLREIRDGLAAAAGPPPPAGRRIGSG